MDKRNPFLNRLMSSSYPSLTVFHESSGHKCSLRSALGGGFVDRKSYQLLESGQSPPGMGDVCGQRVLRQQDLLHSRGQSRDSGKGPGRRGVRGVLPVVPCHSSPHGSALLRTPDVLDWHAQFIRYVLANFFLPKSIFYTFSM